MLEEGISTGLCVFSILVHARRAAHETHWLLLNLLVDGDCRLQ
jgi:hypothetical protein